MKKYLISLTNTHFHNDKLSHFEQYLICRGVMTTRYKFHHFSCFKRSPSDRGCVFTLTTLETPPYPTLVTITFDAEKLISYGSHNEISRKYPSLGVATHQ